MQREKELGKKMNIQIKKSFDNFCLDVSFSEDSKRIGILGASGCGKSMLLKSIAGVIRPDVGRIEINGRLLYDSDMKINLTPQVRRVGYLFQNYALFPKMNVSENISVGIGNKNKAEKKQILTRTISKFKLQGLEHLYPYQLSGGQQQRVALARIMAYRPDVILLDEPFSALDSYLRIKLLEELMEMTADYDGSMILVSHSRDEIYYFSEKLLIMDKGRLVGQNRTKEIFRQPKSAVAARLTGCKNISKVKKMDDFHVLAIDFGIVLTLRNKLEINPVAMGYRAHDFLPVWGDEEENCIPLNIKSIMDLPFETNYSIYPKIFSQELRFTNEADIAAMAANKDPDSITWRVQRERKMEMEKRGNPDFLKFVEDRMMFFEC